MLTNTGISIYTVPSFLSKKRSILPYQYNPLMAFFADFMLLKAFS
jgi:hypothetical protein